MPLNAALRRAATACAAAITATALLSASAAASVAPPGGGCPAQPTVKPFIPWQDAADYVLAPDGGFEHGAGSWELSEGATVVAGNEPFRVGGAGDKRSLQLAHGAVATTASFCIGVEHISMRFFVRGPQKGNLKVEALYTKASGKQKSVKLEKLKNGGAWAPSDIVPMQVNTLAGAFGNAMPVQLRFSAKGSWQIDDVYVDPFVRG